ncbi:recombinase family protein [Streptomyces sp. 11x1]|uniref:recombinase family protein n=1 Tax=Streptomyces sp. 11x1 TaxID=3038642 RepID=UPI0037DA2400
MRHETEQELTLVRGTELHPHETHSNRRANARVSTDDREAQLQRDALTAAGCARIFEDKVSGKNTDRPELTAVLD